MYIKPSSRPAPPLPPPRSLPVPVSLPLSGDLRLDVSEVISSDCLKERKLNKISIRSGLRRNFFGTNHRVRSRVLLASERFLPNCKWKAVTSGFNSDERSYPRRYLHGSFVS